MKTLKTLFTILIYISYSIATAQTEESKESKETKEKQNPFAFLEIRDARRNDDDVTIQALQEKATLILYQMAKTNSIMLANYWEKSNSQSFGPIFSIVKSKNPDKKEENKSEVYTFYWSYYNTYDQKKGTAEIKLLVIYKPQGTYFEITVIPENLDELVYKGQMKGDLAILEWNSKK